MVAHFLSNKLLRYMVVGGIATAVDFFVYALCIYGGMDYRLALLCGFTPGSCTNFFLCDRYLFNRGSNPLWYSWLKHYISSAVGLCLNQVGMYVLVTLLACESLILGRIGVSTCTFLINFVLIKTFAFNDTVV